MGSSGLPNKPYTAGFGVPASRTTDAGLFHLGCSMGASIRTICALIMGCLTSKIGGPDRRANRRYGRCAGSSLGMRAALLTGYSGALADVIIASRSWAADHFRRPGVMG